MGPLTFTAVRSAIAACVMGLVRCSTDWGLARRKPKKSVGARAESGVVMTCSNSADRTVTTSAGNRVLCLIVFVPFRLSSSAGRIHAWAACARGGGLYYLRSRDFTMSLGDLSVLAARSCLRFRFVGPITTRPKVTSWAHASVYVNGVLSAIMVLFEEPKVNSTLDSWIPLYMRAVLRLRWYL
jgi:hypothetical protein